MWTELFKKRKLIDLMKSVLNDRDGNVNMRDSAFACYYFLKSGRNGIVKRFIRGTVNEIGLRINGCLDLAFWLWTTGEYLKVAKDLSELDRMKENINYCIECIKTEWDKEYSHWMEEDVSGVFTGNVAVMYAAINGINNFLNDRELGQFLNNLREFTFLECIREGEYVGERGCLEVLGDMGDISAIAVPFGLVNVDDLFFIRSINSLEKKLIIDVVPFSKHSYSHQGSAKADLSCLLSWYYSEAGYIEYADWMLRMADKMLFGDNMRYENAFSNNSWHGTNPSGAKSEQEVERNCLGYILYTIAEQNLRAKKQSKNKNLLKEVNVIHKPVGENDPYSSRNYERYPRYPEVNESVYLKINTLPFNQYQKVYVNYSINGKAQPKISMEIETTPSGERYWQTCIGKFNFEDRVDYTYEIDFQWKKVESQQYSFSVIQWHTLKEIEYVDCTNDRVKLLFKPVGNQDRIPCLCIEKSSDDSLKFSFSMELHEKLYHSINIMEKSNIRIFSFNLGKMHFEFDGYNIHFRILKSNKKHILQSYTANDARLLDVLTDGSGRIYKVRFNFFKEINESFFGMGERFSNIEFAGLDIDNCVYDKYMDHRLKTYLPVPFYISSKGYGVFFDTSTYLKCKFGSRVPDLTEIEINLDSKKQGTDFYVFTGTPKKIIQEYTHLTGKPALPPKWCFGLWISSNSWSSQKEIYEQIEKGQKYEIPTTALILEQWSDEATFYIFSGARYDVKPGNYNFKYEDFDFSEDGRWPNPKKMIDFLHKQGIRVLLWQAPYHTYLGSAVNRQRDVDEKAMLDNGYHVKYKDGKEYRSHFYWFGHCLIPDFTNPEARKWWLEKRLYLIRDIRIDGFKIDGGECILDEGLVFYNGKTEEEMRNQYPNEFVGGYSDFVKQHLGSEGVLFSRAGYKGAQNYPLHWAGDDESTFKAFRESINAGLSSGISGIPFWGWDFGGFCGEIPTAELYLRSTQMSVFCPIMQYHSESMEKQIYDRTPWNVAERTNSTYVIDIFKKYIDLRMNILPYIYQQAVVSSRTGIPMMRAMFLEYPLDEDCITLTGQYIFGESMLVAPQAEEGVITKDIYLPEGKWMDFFTGEVLEGGGFIKADTEIHSIPVYVKENSIIPLNLSNELRLFSHVGNELNCYKNLCFLIYATSDTNFKFFDDLENEITFEVSALSDIVSIKLEGNYADSVTLIFRNVSAVGSVEVEGNEILRVDSLEALKAETYISLSDSLMIRLGSCNKSTQVRLLPKEDCLEVP